MNTLSFRYAKNAAIALVVLFLIGMAISLIPALRFVNWISIFCLLIYLSFGTLFALIYIDSNKTSPLKSPVILGIVGFSLMTLYALFYWTDISRGSFADLHKVLSCLASIVAMLWLCKFFKKGTRIQFAAITFGAILLLSLIIDIVSTDFLTNAILDFANKGEDMGDALGKYVILSKIESYTNVALALFSAWFMYDYSLIKK